MKTRISQSSICKKFFCALLMASTLLVFGNFAQAQQTIDDFSVLPENLTGNITSNPNVLIILDTSSSMGLFTINNGSGLHETDPETGVGYRDFDSNTGVSSLRHFDPSSSFSNSYQVREAMRNILNSAAFEGRLNVGLMAFGQNTCTYNPNNNLPSNGDLILNKSCLGGNTSLGTNGLGLLRANIQPLSGDHKDNLLELLRAEPTPWNSSNIGFDRFGRDYVVFSGNTDLFPRPINGLNHPWLSNSSATRRITGNEDTILTSGNFGNGTPLGGSLESAFRYLFRNDEVANASSTGTPSRLKGGLRSREYSLGTETTEDADGNEVQTPVAIDYLTQTQCEGPLTVILLTDGDPSQLPPSNLNSGNGNTTSQGASTSVNSAVSAARRIRYRGFTSSNDAVGANDEVEVFVVGFNLNNETAANQIASAGGTDQAIITTSSEEVEAAFSDIFNEILEQGATRSGLSIIATPDSATGSFVQPSFTPLTQETSSTGSREQVVWTGDVRNFFIDRFGNFREDTVPPGSTEGNNVLDSGDKGFRILFDQDTDLTYVERFDVGADGEALNITGSPDGDGGFSGGFIAVADLEAVWSATDQLDRLSDELNRVDDNRTYTNAVTGSNNGRSIYTWLDNDSNGRFSSGEGNDFTWSDNTGNTDEINPNNKGVFDLPAGANSNDDAEDLVNFIRGYQASSGNTLRNRKIGEFKYLLGDIVHSTPVQVDEPAPLSFSTNPLNTDDLRDSYEPFADHYFDRRKMVYVGANDGMLHAFNGGFWTIDSVAGTITVDRQLTGETNHQLGDEIWAFIPNAVLPHLKFLQDPNYAADQHVAFVDGSLEAFEVKIFDSEPDNCANVSAGDAIGSNCKYINGWGTILVGGLRFGGADYTADFNGNGTSTTKTSSYFIIDITDPERPPELIDEITHPDLNLTVSMPALVRAQGSSSTDREYRLVFGSGPNVLASATNESGLAASMFIYDLEDRDGLTQVSLPSASTTSFIGDLTSIDWNLDDIDDAIYFGTVAGTVENPTGKLFRSTLTLGSTSDSLNSSVIFDVGLPIQFRPIIPADHETQNDKYILLGTGRTYSLDDTSEVYSPVNKLFGVKESFVGSILSNPIVFGSSPIASSTQILDTNSASPTATDEGDTIINGLTRAEVLAAFEDETTAPVYRGWEFDLPEGTSRLSAGAVTLQELVFFTDYQPQDPSTITTDQCLPDGGSFLTVLDYRTGLFPSSQRLEFGASANTGDTTTNFLNFQVSSSLLGEGEILVIGDDADGNTKFKFLAPGSNQEITEFDALLKNTITIPAPVESGRKSWREIPIDN